MHALCFWHIFDDNQLLHHSLCKLSDDVKMDSNTASSALNASHNNKKSQKEKAEQPFQEQVSKSFSKMARS